MNDNDFEGTKAKVTDPQSCFKLMRCKKHIVMPPKYIGYLKTGIKEQLNVDLNCYSERFLGVTMAYNNVRLMQQVAHIHGDSSYLHFDIEADFVLFQPQIGSIVVGVANKMSMSHVGCIVHGEFNASIPRSEGCDAWVGDTVIMGDRFQFEITHIFPHFKTLSLRGRFTDDPQIEHTEYYEEHTQIIEDEPTAEEKTCKIAERVEPKEKRWKRPIKVENTDDYEDLEQINIEDGEGDRSVVTEEVTCKKVHKKKRKSLKSDRERELKMEPGAVIEGMGQDDEVIKMELEDSGVMDYLNDSVDGVFESTKKKKKKKRELDVSFKTVNGGSGECRSWGGVKVEKEDVREDEMGVRVKDKNRKDGKRRSKTMSRLTWTDPVIDPEGSLFSDYGSVDRSSVGLHNVSDPRVPSESFDSVFCDQFDDIDEEMERSGIVTDDCGHARVKATHIDRKHSKKRKSLVSISRDETGSSKSIDTHHLELGNTALCQIKGRVSEGEETAECVSSFEARINDLSLLTQSVQSPGSRASKKRKHPDWSEEEVKVEFCVDEGLVGREPVKKRNKSKHKKHKRESNYSINNE